MQRFAGFELDRPRLELRHAGGAVIPLRPKTFDLLCLLATHPGQIVAKQDLMSAIWPNVHVGDDSLFQCIRELRLALGDEARQLIKVVSGRGYRLDAEIIDLDDRAGASAVPEMPATPPTVRRPVTSRRWLAAAAILLLAAGAIATPMLARVVFPHTPTLAILPFTATGGDARAVELAANVTGRLIDGFADTPNVEVTAPSSGPAAADFVLTGTLQQSGGSWTVQGRLTRGAASEVLWADSFAVDAATAPDLELQESRLAAAVGHDLSARLNMLLNDGTAPPGPAADTGKVVVQQANAYITQQTPERFHAAQSMLEDGLARDPDNVDIKVALAAQLMRGVQMMFYTRAENDAARQQARTILEDTLETPPNSVPVHEAYCRFLTSTNQFKEALVACARTLTYDPWNGIALYHLGLAEMNLGRFDDALRTFRLADSFDTPEVSRWTWKLGAGWTLMLMDKPAQALPWLERAIAITPASGRVYFLIAAVYQSLGRPDDAADAIAKGLETRPGSTAANIAVPMANTSPLFATASDRLTQRMVAAGLPAK